jgi:hypothetical protein
MAACGSLFVYGGDVYQNGTDDDFMAFHGVYGDVLPWLAATPGNHDWYTACALGYEWYWRHRQPPRSCTLVDPTKVGPCRHHYAWPLGNGWLGIFIDCGPSAKTPLTPAALSQVDYWITSHGSRRIIVFLHHARLSRGLHGNNKAMDPLWQACFDSQGVPRVGAWVAGHNHNMGIYSPRMQGSGPNADPPVSPSGISGGVQIFVNGAGGAALYAQADANGTMPDAFADDAHFGFLQIQLTDAGTAIFQNYSTGDVCPQNAAPIGPPVTIG